MRAPSLHRSTWDLVIDSAERGFVIGGLRLIAAAVLLTVVVGIAMGGVS